MPHEGMSLAPRRASHESGEWEDDRGWLHDRDFGFGDFELVSRPARRRVHPAPAAPRRVPPQSPARRASGPASAAPRPVPAPAPSRPVPAPAPSRPVLAPTPSRPVPAPAPPHPVPAPAADVSSPTARRTITIQGRGSDRTWSPTGAPPVRRAPRPSYGRVGTKPDRVALWAVLLGIVLVLVAATSSHAAVLHAHHAARLLIGH